MKSSAIGRILVGARRDRFRRLRRGPAREALERDPGEDQHAARDLEGAERLVQQEEREEDGEERLQVAEERGPRGADAVDRGEPEDVREEERADDGIAEPEPHLPAERELLLAELRARDGGERDPAER